MPVYGVRTKVGPAPQGVKIDMVAPGSKGLNLEQQNVVLDYSWAIEAQNCVLDSNGRLAARSLFQNNTITPIPATPRVRSLFEHRRAAGTVDLIIAWDGGISATIADPAGSSLAGTGTYTSGRWKFLNFNDKCVGLQAGQKFIVRPSAGGSFNTVVEAVGTAPSGGVGTAAFGRVWIADVDGHTIKYCSLLDETTWSGGSSGSIDMQTIWVDGTDVITAITAFDGNLVVFGKRHIVLFNDGTSGALGMNPTNMVISGILTGTGCIAQHSIAAIGDSDLFFLSPTGVQSLGRLLVNKSNPLTQVTKYVRTSLMTMVASESDLTAITAVYSPAQNLYLLALPANGYVWALDTKRRFTDEYGDDCCVVTRWNQTLYAMYETVARALYVSRTAGKVAGYGIGGDTTEEISCRYIWQSPWQDFAQWQVGDRLKMLTRLGGQFHVEAQNNVVFKWWTDFATPDAFSTVTLTVSGAAGADWGTAEYGVDEWGGGLVNSNLVYDARAQGQYFRFGFETDATGPFATQQAFLFAKVGRLQA